MSEQESESESESAAIEAIPTDYLGELQSVVANFDPNALPLNIICIVEWLEPDGSYSMSTVHTPMPVWHMRGLLSWAEDVASLPMVSMDEFDGCEDCEGCEECED